MTEPKPTTRKAISKADELSILVRSQRRCCLCFYIDQDHNPKDGQIAHLDRNPSNSSEENLVFLCLQHHSSYDSRSRQAKGYTAQEVRQYRNRLYSAAEQRVAVTEAVHVSPPPNGERWADLIVGKWQIERHWRSRWRIGNGPALFAYKSPNGFDGICRVEAIGLSDGRIAVICEQVPDNPGMSITNAIEFVAFQICVAFSIEPDRLVLIEHYEEKLFGQEDPWLRVEFEKEPPDSFFEGPTWTEMDDLDWQDLGIKPKTKRKSRESLVRRLR
jgi:hypothetical protein